MHFFYKLFNFSALPSSLFDIKFSFPNIFLILGLNTVTFSWTKRLGVSLGLNRFFKVNGESVRAFPSIIGVVGFLNCNLNLWFFGAKLCNFSNYLFTNMIPNYLNYLMAYLFWSLQLIFFLQFLFTLEGLM